VPEVLGALFIVEIRGANGFGRRGETRMHTRKNSWLRCAPRPRTAEKTAAYGGRPGNNAQHEKLRFSEAARVARSKRGGWP
jgi:hypothetical protein